MFTKIGALLTALLKDLSTTFVTLFVIGFVVAAILSAFGGEQHKSKFTAAMWLCGIATGIFFLAPYIVTYLQTSLK